MCLALFSLCLLLIGCECNRFAGRFWFDCDCCVCFCFIVLVS